MSTFEIINARNLARHATSDSERLGIPRDVAAALDVKDYFAFAVFTEARAGRSKARVELRPSRLVLRKELDEIQHEFRQAGYHCTITTDWHDSSKLIGTFRWTITDIGVLGDRSAIEMTNHYDSQSTREVTTETQQALLYEIDSMERQFLRTHVEFYERMRKLVLSM